MCSFYQILRRGGDDSFPWREVWRVRDPPRACFFVWSMVKGKILITNNLQKGVFSFRIGVLFANLMGRALIIYFCIVWLRVSFGISFLSLGPQLGNA